MRIQNLLLRLSLALMGAGTSLFGVVSLVKPTVALEQFGLAGSGDLAMFQSAFLGATAVPWGIGLLVSARSPRISRLWIALALLNALAVLVVLIYFWGAKALQLDRMWPFLALYGICLLGIATFGQRELKGSEEVFVRVSDPESPHGQRGYTTEVDRDS